MSYIPFSAKLTTAYSLDLSTLPAQNLLTGGDGTKTIDSKAAWILIQSVNANTVYLNDGTHQGLYIKCSTTSTDDYTTTYNGPRFVVPLTDLSGLKIQNVSEIWVWAMFTQPHTPNANYEFSRLGIQEWPANNDTSGTYKRIMLPRGYSGGQATGFEWHSAGSTVTNPSGTTDPTFASDVYVYRIGCLDESVQVFWGASVSGSFPDISTLRLVGSGSFRSTIAGLDTLSINGAHSDIFQWAFTFNATTGNTAGNSDFLLQKLLVQYR